MANKERTFLINGLLRAVSHEQPLDLAMLREHGISSALAAHYARTGWLERLGTGVYCVAGARLDRDQSLLFLQGRIEGLHVGGRTALAWLGVRQYLEVQERLTMWATVRGVLPAWFTERFPGTLTSLNLFDEATRARGIVTPPAVTEGVKVSSRERALLELLREVRTALQLQEARELFFATLGLRTAVAGELLTGCTSVKTVRLFLMWATDAGNLDVEALRTKF
ncbi:MAG: AbiEi antitoxin N-terminal domain-containing protein, partial [Candidatus Nanopelagicales bacterium]